MRKLYDDRMHILSESIDSLTIKMASPDEIRSWSHGIVCKPDTINYRTYKPEPGGLFCQRIFGPVKDYECSCGASRGDKDRKEGTVCPHCGVQLVPASVRRERMGHIELASPMAHIWYTRGTSSHLSKLLDIKQKDIDVILSYTSYIVVEAGNTDLRKLQVLDEKEYSRELEKWDDEFKALTGAEAFKYLLSEIDIDETLKNLMNEYTTSASKAKRQKAFTRYKLFKSLKDSGNRPEWIILDVLPVMPPDLRPMAQLSGGNFAISDINELYKRVISRNNRLRDMLEKGAPTVIVNNERRMLQNAVDCLLANDKVNQKMQATGVKGRHLKSISEALGGKQGRFRQNLLGKRVDYSGRSVIVVEPKLKMWQCGLPKELAAELFKPFVVKRLIDTKVAGSIRIATKMIDRRDERIWDALENVIDGHPVFLNRAPTLHRLGIQAFQPVLVEGHAIRLNPLVCTAFNADFDGDQMAVHLPVSAEAQAEARFLMLAANNLLKPSDGKPVAVPSQDMVLGAYYLTMDKPNQPGDGMVFRDKAEAEMAHANKLITLHSKIKVRRTGYYNNEPVSKLLDCTLGRLIFNEIIPQDLGYVDRTDKEHCLDLEINFLVKKKQLGAIADKCVERYDMTKASEVLDNMKAYGYKYATLAGITVSVFDATIPEEKAEIVSGAEKRIERLNYLYQRGYMTRAEKSKWFITTWNKATDDVTTYLEEHFDTTNNPIHIMADSGARGSISQIRQLAGMRGLIANTSGATIEMPIKANYREGLSGLEYFISARGARKGLADTALRTADSGYMTRRLVDVAHSAVIREEDCGCNEGIHVCELKSGEAVLETFEERLIGRYLVNDFEKDGVHISKDKLITREDAEKIIGTGVESVEVRSALTCRCKNGICSKCYGVNLATNKPVKIGDAVGVISAQSIGEPGTQLTMRTFHTGGIASGGDITQGLPRVEEIFENRNPKSCAVLSEIDGTVSYDNIRNMLHIKVVPDEGEPVSYAVSYNMKPVVKPGDRVKAGDFLTSGVIKPGDLLDIKGAWAAQEYIITEVQKVYRVQGVDINDKHIEVIVRYLMSKVRITDPGSSKVVRGAEYSKLTIQELNDKLQARIDNGENLKLVQYVPVLEGLKQAGTRCESFLSAASFQETTRVLSNAAFEGKSDSLVGLKENVIIGKLIPAGTGLVDKEAIQITKKE